MFVKIVETLYWQVQLAKETSLALPVGSGLMRYDTVVLLSATFSAPWTNKRKKKSTRLRGVCSPSLSLSYSAAEERSFFLPPTLPSHSISVGPPGFTPPQTVLLKEEAVTTVLYRDNALPEESISFRR